MMSHGYLPPRNILDLPPEIVVKIVRKLPYTDIQSVLLTCWAFNDAGMYVQKTSLHKMRGTADCALRRCHVGFQNINETRALRALRGTASVKCLSGIIRVSDAATFHFILDGVLPPPPAALLADTEKALKIATKRNPLVGRDRLKRIFSGYNKYLTKTMNGLNASLKAVSVFRSVTDLLASLPLKTYIINQTAYGLHCLIYLNFLTVTVNRICDTLTAPLLIQFLAKLNVKGIEEFININMGNLFAEEIQTVDATIDLIEMTIVCRPEESVGVNSLKQICRLEPTDFQIFLHGVSFVRPPDQRNFFFIQTTIRGRPLLEGEEIVTYTYSTRSPSLLGEYGHTLSNNSVSTAVVTLYD